MLNVIKSRADLDEYERANDRETNREREKEGYRDTKRKIERGIDGN